MQASTGRTARALSFRPVRFGVGKGKSKGASLQTEGWGRVCLPSPSLPPARAPMGSRGTPLPLCPWPPDLRFVNYMQHRGPNPARTNVLPARPSSPVLSEISSSQGFPPGVLLGTGQSVCFSGNAYTTRPDRLDYAVELLALCALCRQRCPGVRLRLVSGFRNTQDCKIV